MKIFNKSVYCTFFAALLLCSCATTKNTEKPTVTLSESELWLRDSLFYEAVKQKDTEKFDEAMSTFLRCNEIDSANAEIHSELGLLYLGKNNNALAINHLKTSVKLAPRDWWYSFQLLSVLMHIGDDENALGLAQQMQRFHPEKKQIYSILATLYTYRKDIKKAIKAYDDLEKLTGMNEEISIDKFTLHLQNRDIKAAFAEIERLLKEYPHETRYKILKANMLMKNSRKAEAFVVFTQTLKDDPHNPLVYVSLAEYYLSVNEKDKALAMITDALKSDALDIGAKMEIMGEYMQETLKDTTQIAATDSLLKVLVERYPLEEQTHAYYYFFLKNQQRESEAISELETMLNINPKNEQAWGELIQNYLTDEKFDKVLTTCEEAIKSLPDMPQFYYFCAIASFQLEKYVQTIENLRIGVEKVVREREMFKSDFYALMADTYYKIEEKDSAFTAYENALKYNVSNIYVLNNYAYYLSLEKRDLRKAEMMSAKTVEKEPNNSTYLDTYAWILYERGSVTLAKIYIEKALENLDKREENGVIYDHCGDIYDALGNHQKALEMWHKAAEQGENTDAVKQKIATSTLKK